MTNYEKIKNMTIDEMSKLLCHRDRDCKNCPCDNTYYCNKEIKMFKKWLESEAKE